MRLIVTDQLRNRKATQAYGAARRCHAPSSRSIQHAAVGADASDNSADRAHRSADGRAVLLVMNFVPHKRAGRSYCHDG
jgi:hypothetical protein